MEPWKKGWVSTRGHERAVHACMHAHSCLAAHCHRAVRTRRDVRRAAPRSQQSAVHTVDLHSDPRASAAAPRINLTTWLEKHPANAARRRECRPDEAHTAGGQARAAASKPPARRHLPYTRRLGTPRKNRAERAAPQRPRVEACVRAWRGGGRGGGGTLIGGRSLPSPHPRERREATAQPDPARARARLPLVVGAQALDGQARHAPRPLVGVLVRELLGRVHDAGAAGRVHLQHRRAGGEEVTGHAMPCHTMIMMGVEWTGMEYIRVSAHTSCTLQGAWCLLDCVCLAGMPGLYVHRPACTARQRKPPADTCQTAPSARSLCCPAWHARTMKEWGRPS